MTYKLVPNVMISNFTMKARMVSDEELRNSGPKVANKLAKTLKFQLSYWLLILLSY